ncbi:MAG: phosphopantothenoylcysteine decarboxylase, partial [Paludibacteraceae bacterium]|nr:phosphopantothenoylcysteine decarboxylase [Paludibacteraceae bacterium]
LQANLPLTGKNILITAGPTYEKIDPVRFIGNYSSGKMGYAIAETCAQLGATVTLVSGPVQIKAQHANIHVTTVESAAEMFQATTTAFSQADAAILCAAVADFTPATKANSKIKRGDSGMSIELQPTKDIAAALGSAKKDTQVLVGFALETDNEAANAASKLARKNLDFIVLNSLRNPGTCFGYDNNQITIIDRNGQTKAFPAKSKQAVAADIVENLCEWLNK